MDTPHLLEYLKNVKNLELNCYVYKQSFNNIMKDMEKLGIPSVKSEPQKKKVSFWKGFVTVLFVIGVVISAFIFLMSYSYGEVEALPEIIRKAMKFYREASVAEKLYISIGTSLSISFIYQCFSYVLKIRANKKQYQKEYTEYEEALAADNARLQKELLLKENLENKADECRNNYWSTKKLLDNAYANGVIYPKYQALIPVTKFLEYLTSGRCTQLAGDNQAYNLYELEVRQNIIIAEIGKLSTHLESMGKTQYVLYGEMIEANRRIEQLSESAYQIEHDARIAKYNSQSAAWNASAARSAAEKSNRFV